MGPSIEEIREILRIFLDSEMRDLRLEIGDVRLAVSKDGAGGFAGQPFDSSAPAGKSSQEVAPAPSPQSASEPASEPAPAPVDGPSDVPEGWVAVTAPSVGVFYRRPAPDQPPFVEEGSVVAENDSVCLIEVMKMFTGVTAPCRGRIARIAIEDAATVEFGQILMYIEPA